MILPSGKKISIREDKFMCLVNLGSVRILSAKGLVKASFSTLKASDKAFKVCPFGIAPASKR